MCEPVKNTYIFVIGNWILCFNWFWQMMDNCFYRYNCHFLYQQKSCLNPKRPLRYIEIVMNYCTTFFCCCFFSLSIWQVLLSTTCLFKPFSKDNNSRSWTLHMPINYKTWPLAGAHCCLETIDTLGMRSQVNNETHQPLCWNLSFDNDFVDLFLWQKWWQDVFLSFLNFLNHLNEALLIHEKCPFYFKHWMLHQCTVKYCNNMPSNQHNT